mgnify:CR=1 FL=1
MKAPEIKHYINWLGRVEYRNINCSFTYDETSYAAIDRIFRLLHQLIFIAELNRSRVCDSWAYIQHSHLLRSPVVHIMSNFRSRAHQAHITNEHID